MAGDWIKVEKDTPDKPEVFAIAAKLGMDPEIVFAKCFKLWRWADSNTVDGAIGDCNADVTLDHLDSFLFHRPGFSQALREVGWLVVRSGSLLVPRFDRHMGQPAKKRALTSARVAAHRAASAGKTGNAPSVTHALPEKRRVEINTTPLTPRSGGNPVERAPPGGRRGRRPSKVDRAKAMIAEVCADAENGSK